MNKVENQINIMADLMLTYDSGDAPPFKKINKSFESQEKKIEEVRVMNDFLLAENE